MDATNIAGGWVFVILAVVTAIGFAAFERWGRSRVVQKELSTLDDAGWQPSVQVRGHAEEALGRLHRAKNLGGGLAGAVAFLLLALSQNAPLYLVGWVVGPAVVVGAILGAVAAHLRSGRIPLGPRIAEARPRERGDYLGLAGRVVSDGWLLGTVVVAVPVLVQAVRLGTAEAVVLGSLALGAVVIAGATALLGRACLQHPMPAADSQDQRWQAWMRSTVLKEVYGLAWLACCLSMTAMWLGLLWAWPAATAQGQPFAVLVTVVLTLGVPVWWWERSSLPRVLEGVHA